MILVVWVGGCIDGFVLVLISVALVVMLVVWVVILVVLVSGFSLVVYRQFQPTN